MPTEQVDLWINNSGVSTHDYFEIYDPGRLNNLVARVAKGSVQDANNAVIAAHHAFLSWRRLDLSERIQAVFAAAKALEQSIPELSPLLTREHGGLLGESQMDFGFGVGAAQFTAGIAESYLVPEVIEDETAGLKSRKSRGVLWLPSFLGTFRSF